VLLSTVVMTALIVIFGEILPKTLAIAHADDVARTLSIPTTFVVRTFGPLARGAQYIVARRCVRSASASAWRSTCWPPTRRSAAPSSTITPKARWSPATARCSAACWTSPT
jgi:hypothetical protein